MNEFRPWHNCLTFVLQGVWKNNWWASNNYCMHRKPSVSSKKLLVSIISVICKLVSFLFYFAHPIESYIGLLFSAYSVFRTYIHGTKAIARVWKLWSADNQPVVYKLHSGGPQYACKYTIRSHTALSKSHIALQLL